jgi:protein-S-isoprenylcysteine O-methyltransferase Ste14
MDPALNLAPLLLTVAAREIAETALRPRGRSRGAGKASVAIWYLAYFAIMALAVSRAWSTPLASAPWGGYALLWSGIALRLRSLREIGAYYNSLILIKDAHRLVDTGPYRWLRHPLHLGLHVEMAGLAWLGGAAEGWLILGLSLIVLMRRNLEEERALEGFFGAAYREYRRQARDLVDLLAAGRGR